MRLSDEQFKKEVLERKREALAERRSRIRLTVSLLSVSVCTVAAALLFGPLTQKKITSDAVSEEQYSILLEDFVDTENDNGISSSVVADDAAKSDTSSKKSNTVSNGTATDETKGDTAKGGLTVGNNRNEETATDANLNFASFFGNLDFKTATCDCPTEYTVTTEKGEYHINLTTGCVRFGDLSATLSKSEYATLSKLLKGE